MNNNQDLIVQYAILWGIEIADSRNNSKRHDLLKSWDSVELLSLFKDWVNEYLKGDIEDSVDFFNNKLGKLLNEDCSNKELPVNPWEDLQNKYPMEREEMDDETEKSFVEDCFTLYEKEGFSPVYWSPFTDHKKREGQKIEIVGRCTIEDEDLCVLPMWKAKFPDGEIIHVYPEEVIPSEMRANGCRLFNDKDSLTDKIQSAEVSKAPLTKSTHSELSKGPEL